MIVNEISLMIQNIKPKEDYKRLISFSSLFLNASSMTMTQSMKEISKENQKGINKDIVNTNAFIRS